MKADHCPSLQILSPLTRGEKEDGNPLDWASDVKFKDRYDVGRE